jgi:CDP-paratose 2-epimerase
VCIKINKTYLKDKLIYMNIVLITGSAGLVGAEAVRFFASKGLFIIGIDNNMRKVFFGDEASTEINNNRLKEELGNKYIHYNIDIGDKDAVENVFNTYHKDIKLIIHTAAQPSHDWAAKAPFTDFKVNAYSTLLLLEMTRKYCPSATFIFTSTNKVYGDTPNKLPFTELETRWEVIYEY